MSYGIQVFNASGATLIDTDFLTNMQVPSGVTTFNANSNYTVGSKEINMYGRGSTTLTTSLHFNAGQGKVYLSGAAAINRISIKETIADTSVPSSGGYGIKIFNASGTVKQTYSDAYSNSFDILHIYSPGTVSGNNGRIYTGSTTGIFVGTGGSYFSGSTYLNQFYLHPYYINFVNYYNVFFGNIYPNNAQPIIVAKFRS